ncbi:hypothetical protein ElyMa_005280700 [Elysia marginata]|uniref:Uncharacterized protein n=1 Tax=Elysia marginata TaxID=1093978 RepID=A0AAV4K2Z2_9GAST|nr:hypothetical protein ElyMa_005280700 [Elysia marginata]
MRKDGIQTRKRKPKGSSSSSSGSKKSSSKSFESIGSADDRKPLMTSRPSPDDALAHLKLPSSSILGTSDSHISTPGGGVLGDKVRGSANLTSLNSQRHADHLHLPPSSLSHHAYLSSTDDRKQLGHTRSRVNGGGHDQDQPRGHHLGQPVDSQSNSNHSISTSGSTTNNNNNNNNSSSSNTTLGVHQHLQQQQQQSPHESEHSHHNFLHASGVTSLSDPFGSMTSSKALSLGSRSSAYGLMATSQLYGQIPASLSPLSHVSRCF